MLLYTDEYWIYWEDDDDDNVDVDDEYVGKAQVNIFYLYIYLHLYIIDIRWKIIYYVSLCIKEKYDSGKYLYISLSVDMYVCVDEKFSKIIMVDIIVVDDV